MCAARDEYLSRPLYDKLLVRFGCLLRVYLEKVSQKFCRMNPNSIGHSSSFSTEFIYLSRIFRSISIFMKLFIDKRIQFFFWRFVFFCVWKIWFFFSIGKDAGRLLISKTNESDFFAEEKNSIDTLNLFVNLSKLFFSEHNLLRAFQFVIEKKKFQF